MMKQLTDDQQDILAAILYDLEDMLEQKGTRLYVNDDLTGRKWICENDIAQFIEEQKEYYNVQL